MLQLARFRTRRTKRLDYNFAFSDHDKVNTDSPKHSYVRTRRHDKLRETDAFGNN